MIRDLTRLFRLRLSLMNGVAALGGCLLFPVTPGIGTMAQAAGGVILLAMGGSALNQLLERDLDCLMIRTMDRPLPRRSLDRATVSLLAAATVISGTAALAAAGGLLPSLLGLLALLWYLALYTPLKRRTPLALPLGAVSGALPPIIGWVVSGGAPADFRIVILAGLLYLWQVPHFWYFQQRHAEDYRRAGIPLFHLHPGQFGLWTAALIVAALLLPLFGLAGRQSLLWFVLLPLLLAAFRLSRSERLCFSCLNLVPLLITFTLALSR